VNATQSGWSTGVRHGAVALGLLLALSACGKGADSEKRATAVDERGADKPDQDLYLAMNKALVANGCSNCHNADYARVGPAMRDVAAVYQAEPAEGRKVLKESILHGVQGKWGKAIMPPQIRMTEAGADAIVEAILAMPSEPKAN
jgi:cytochrome c551/c552